MISVITISVIQYSNVVIEDFENTVCVLFILITVDHVIAPLEFKSSFLALETLHICVVMLIELFGSLPIEIDLGFVENPIRNRFHSNSGSQTSFFRLCLWAHMAHLMDDQT